ncbi:MAG: phage minor head protein [Candidatus Methanomethylophilus sp.]|nr:phage minor head protein [Methanomethylophilus sp.]
MMARPKRIKRPQSKSFDPSKTTILRQAFIRAMNKRLLKLKQDVLKWILEEDELGLLPVEIRQVGNRRTYAFATTTEKVSVFRRWFTNKVKQGVLETDGVPAWTDEYVHSAYRKGLVHSYLESRRRFLAAIDPRFIDLARDEFLKEAFAAPETVKKIQSIYTRTFETLKDYTHDMAVKTSSTLAEGLANGLHPSQIARELTSKMDNLSRSRALTIARTEIIHSHAEGQLDGYEKLGVKEVGADVEWSTSGDSRVCEECATMEGVVMKIEEARGKIPLHPNCRCAWIPIER